MIQRQKRIVLFLPHRADPSQGVRVSAEEEHEGLDVAEHGSPAYTD